MNLQQRVANWMYAVFGPEVAADKYERGMRFGEEAIELLQAGGLTKVDILKLIRRVYSRPVGEKCQEVGGTLVTLAAWCEAHGISMLHEADVEMHLLTDPARSAKILAKQQGKRDELAVPLIDHEELLRKYIALVQRPCAGTYTFSPEEETELLRIATTIN